MRTTFIEELLAQARLDPHLFLSVADLGYSVVDAFAAELPKQYLNAGVAEQNLTGLAAGLAAEGYHVFTYSIANFPTFRCAEQIRNDVAYHGLPVTVVVVGGGLAYGNLGYSHHAVQDYALLRSFPGMTICAPGDPMEVRACLRYLIAHPGPSYLRLGKGQEPMVHATIPEVSPWRFVPLHPDVPARRSTFLTTGTTLALAASVAKSPELNAEWSVHSLPVWSACPDVESVASFIERFDRVVVLEDHLAAGGFGSALREALESKPSLQSRLRCIALDPEICGLVGKQQALNHRGGLTPERILAACSACG